MRSIGGDVEALRGSLVIASFLIWDRLRLLLLLLSIFLRLLDSEDYSEGAGGAEGHLYPEHVFCLGPGHSHSGCSVIYKSP